MRPIYVILTKKTKNVNADASDESRKRFYGLLEKGKSSCGQKTEIYSIKPAQFRTTTLPDAAKTVHPPSSTPVSFSRLPTLSFLKLWTQLTYAPCCQRNYRDSIGLLHGHVPANTYMSERYEGGDGKKVGQETGWAGN